MNNRYALPLAIIGLMFFIVGFAIGINSYLVPLLQSTLEVSSGESYMLIASTFCAFMFFSYPAAKVIGKIGYKKTMSLSFFLHSEHCPSSGNQPLCDNPRANGERSA